MKNKCSYIGRYIPDDGRDLHDRSYGRRSQDFVYRTEETEISSIVVSTSPKMPIEIIKVIRQAVIASGRDRLPWAGVINGLQIQIHSKLTS